VLRNSCNDHARTRFFALDEPCLFQCYRLLLWTKGELRPYSRNQPWQPANVVLGHDDDEADHTINSYAGIVRNGMNSLASESRRNSLIASGKRPRV
jgi:hypothetical protein